VSKNQKEVAGEEKTMADNKKTRDGEQADYATKRADLVDAVDAVEGALETMQNSKKDVGEEIALLQKLPAKILSSTPGLALIAAADTKPGEATKYIYSSNEVIATLQDLTKQFKEELADLDESEHRTQSTFAMAAGARANTIKALQKEIDEDEALSASKAKRRVIKRISRMTRPQQGTLIKHSLTTSPRSATRRRKLGTNAPRHEQRSSRHSRKQLNC
jgi:hypothetical protein